MKVLRTYGWPHINFFLKRGTGIDYNGSDFTDVLPGANTTQTEIHPALFGSWSAGAMFVNGILKTGDNLYNVIVRDLDLNSFGRQPPFNLMLEWCSGAGNSDCAFSEDRTLSNPGKYPLYHGYGLTVRAHVCRYFYDYYNDGPSNGRTWNFDDRTTMWHAQHNAGVLMEDILSDHNGYARNWHRVTEIVPRAGDANFGQSFPNCGSQQQGTLTTHSTQRNDDGSWAAVGTRTAGGPNNGSTDTSGVGTPRINEFHYDDNNAKPPGPLNCGIEVRVPAGYDTSGLELAIYNGVNLRTNTLDDSAATTTTVGNWKYLWWPLSAYVLDVYFGGIGLSEDGTFIEGVTYGDAYGSVDANGNVVYGLGPNGQSHNVYFDRTNRDISIRGFISCRASGSAFQMRGGCFMHDSFLMGNPQCFGPANGVANQNWIQGTNSVIYNVGAHLCADWFSETGESDVPTGYSQSNGLGIYNPASENTFKRVYGFNIFDPQDATDQAHKTEIYNGTASFLQTAYISTGAEANVLETEAQIIDSQVVENCFVWNWKDAPDMGVSGISTAVLNQSTAVLWLDAKDPAGTPHTQADVYDYFETWGAANARRFTALCQEINDWMLDRVGGKPVRRTAAATVTFEPDLDADGHRWSNKLNWKSAAAPNGEDWEPGHFDGDSVDIAGHFVNYDWKTVTVGDFDMGQGRLWIECGKLTIDGVLSCTTAGLIEIPACGQLWVNGYAGAAPLRIELTSARFANYGTFAGNAGFYISGENSNKGSSEFLCAYASGADASMTVAAGQTMEIVGGRAASGDITPDGPVVGFDGNTGHTATLTIEGTLKLTPLNGRIAKIREFRSGANGTSTGDEHGVPIEPDVVSSVVLGATSVLEVDLTGIADGTYDLVVADGITGTFGTVTIAGGSASVSYTTDASGNEVVRLTKTA